MDEFEHFMENQRHMAKSSRSDNSQQQQLEVYNTIKNTVSSPILFEGYDKDKITTTIAALVQDGKVLQSVDAPAQCEIILQTTPFYAEKGGQVGDTGTIQTDTASTDITDTQTPVEGIVTHISTLKKGSLSVGDTVTAQVDAVRRGEIRKHHSVTHLLHFALREVLGEHVKQRGSLVTPEKLRFDFSHYQALTEDELIRITAITNDLIRQNHSQTTQVESLDQARSEGAMALFGEKYGDKVRVVTIGPTKELCGGTHVNASGDIGFFIITNESSISAGVRRIEAICAKTAEHHIIQQEQILKDISSLLSASTGEISSKIEKLIEDNRTLEKSLKEAQIKKGLASVDDILHTAQKVNGTQVIVKNCGESDRTLLRNLGDALKDKLSSGIIALGGKQDENAMFLVMVTKDLVKQGYHAGEIIKQIAQIAGGKGGGRPDMAQAGAKDTSKIDDALKEIFNIIRG